MAQTGYARLSDAVHFVSLGQEEFREKGTVLTSDAGDGSFFSLPTFITGSLIAKTLAHRNRRCPLLPRAGIGQESLESKNGKLQKMTGQERQGE
jgi:hypothetical protein